MKKKIIIGLTIFSLIFLFGGIYIIYSIEHGTSALDNLIKLHKVEILREHLLIQLKMVQADLFFKNTRYARGAATMVEHVVSMDETMQQCFECHHSEKVTLILEDFRDNIEKYKDAVSRILTVRADIIRLDAEEHVAYVIGNDLQAKVNNIIAIANKKLDEKTSTTLKTVKFSKNILFILIILVPVLSTALATIFIRSFTKPVGVLIEATRKIKNVDLHYRIKEKLYDEFAELANAFNEMASSLELQCHKMQRAEQLTVYGEMAAGLAHEIKNPLAGIKGAMKLFANEANLSLENRTVLDKVVNEIKRIESLMKELLSYARPAKPSFMSIDFNDVLEKTTGLLSKYPIFTLGGSKHIEIVKNFDAGMPPVETDPMQQQQVFLNLFLNAADAMPEGGTLTVKTTFDHKENLVQIVVSDTGMGIEADVVNKIFIPFFTTKQKGTGLGLPTSKRLIEQHGGSINCQSEPGHGTSFIIRLPLTQPEWSNAC